MFLALDPANATHTREILNKFSRSQRSIISYLETTGVGGINTLCGCGAKWPRKTSGGGRPKWPSTVALENPRAILHPPSAWLAVVNAKWIPKVCSWPVGFLGVSVRELVVVVVEEVVVAVGEVVVVVEVEVVVDLDNNLEARGTPCHAHQEMPCNFEESPFVVAPKSLPSSRASSSSSSCECEGWKS
ncbi:hypothetical protein Pcinc_030480 [Petrolisthes cinctipes]|uniref:Uncharacterized protein n=1 Tax=Petrolisthes cinctipes TaxID=88211 RepID=A0AAE1K464_PETCI|nr:hypothetical protein Pcinc_030480 [Petrolisthes cinctipes]